MERITSLQNPLIKRLAKLNTPAARRDEGMFLLEGIKLCEEALDNGLEICYCFYGEDCRASELANRVKGGSCYQVSEHIIEKLSTLKTPQNIVMAARIPDESGRAITGTTVLALDGISDPANLGSLLRTAEAFGVTDILCSERTVDMYSTKVLRGAMGSSFRVHMHRGDLAVCLNDLRAEGYTVYATALTGNDILLHQTTFSGKSVIVIGNEGNGVSDKILALADKTLLIPMAGQNESLNAAAAAAVVLGQCYAQKEL